MRFLYLIRHGLHFTEATIPGGPVGGLTPVGVEQATLTARRVRQIPFQIIHCSTLRRAVETARIIRRARARSPLRKAHILRESIPILPYRSIHVSRELGPKEIARARAKAEQAYSRYFRKSRGADRHELIVTHGNLIRYLICRALGASPRAWANMRINNCGVSEIVVKRDGSLTLASYNDTGHLPSKLVT
jgi:serine/threonine-protein phosphatase PGAM5